MRPLFAAKSRIDSNVFGDTAHLVQEWIEDYYNREAVEETPSLCEFSDEPSEEELVDQSEEWSPVERHCVETAHKATTYGKLYELKWEQPPDTDAPDATRVLRVAVLSGDEERVIFEVNAALDLQSFRVAPLESGITRRPNIVPRLVKRFDCKVGNTLVYSYPQKIGKGDARSFIREDVAARDRRVPVVLLSHCSDTGTPIREPDWVQDRLLGLANVCEITGPASQVLSEHLGPARSCKVERLEKRLEQAQENLQAVGRHALTGSVQEEDTKRKEEVTTLGEALQYAEEQHGEYTYVWKSARQAAKNAQYHQSEEIVDVLEAVSDLAEKYDRQDGEVGRWRDHFQERGIDFSYQESESTMNQHGEEREFHDGDQMETMEAHITIGQNHDHCLQIFFDKPNGDDQRFRIGYCGEHLSIASRST
jgi:hypothetical protein